MTITALWKVTLTRRDGSVHSYTERRGRHPEMGEVIEIRNVSGRPIIARIHIIHHDPPKPGALEVWDVTAEET